MWYFSAAKIFMNIIEGKKKYIYILSRLCHVIGPNITSMNFSRDAIFLLRKIFLRPIINLYPPPVVSRPRPNAMDSWMIFQLTLSEVMTLGWQATRRCILCTLATRLFHHPHIPTKIPHKIITRPAQLALNTPPIANRAFRNTAARSCWVPRAAKAASSGTTRFAATAVARRVAIFRTRIPRSITRIRWITCSGPCRPCTTSTRPWTAPLNWDIRKISCTILALLSTVRSRVSDRLVRSRRSKLEIRLSNNDESSSITCAISLWGRFTPIRDWPLIRVENRASSTGRRLDRNETADPCLCTRVTSERRRTLRRYFFFCTRSLVSLETTCVSMMTLLFEHDRQMKLPAKVPTGLLLSYSEKSYENCIAYIRTSIHCRVYNDKTCGTCNIIIPILAK